MPGKQQEKHRPSDGVIADSRFSAIHSDPRFQKARFNKQKLKIDKRFKSVLTDKRFQIPEASVDKYGRKRADVKHQHAKKSSHDMRRFYQLAEEGDDDEDESDLVQAVPSSPDAAAEEKDENANTGYRKRSDEQVEIEHTKNDSSSEYGESSDEDEESDDKSEEMEEVEEESRLDYLNRLARGEVEVSSEDSEGEFHSSSEDEEEDDELIKLMKEEEMLFDDIREKEEDIPKGEETCRLAVMNCDWSRMHAKDLLAVFQSFCPPSGAVSSVKIYPSEYGLKKMAEEQLSGPSEIFSHSAGVGSAAIISSETFNLKESLGEEDTGSENDEDDPLGVMKKKPLGEAEKEEIRQQNRIRRYEMQKLKYYFAVVTCDSIKTASAIYDQCDKLEFESSSNHLDLRFIPEDIEFTHAEPKDSCSVLPADYKPPAYTTKALQHTSVDLTWEEDDEDRSSKLTRFNKWTELKDSDFAAFIASSESEEDDGKEEKVGEAIASNSPDHSVSSDDDGLELDSKKRNKQAKDSKKKVKKKAGSKKNKKVKELRQKYKSLLFGSADPREEGSDNESAELDGEGNMQMTFIPDLGKDILEKKKKKELEEAETPWEKYLREKREKKKEKRREQKKRKGLEESESDAGSDNEEFSDSDADDMFNNTGLLARDRGADKASALGTAEKKKQNKHKRKSTGEDTQKNLQVEYDDQPAGNSQLMASDEEDERRDFDMKAIARRDLLSEKKLRGRRRKKEEQRAASAALQEDFEMQLDDPRFAALYREDGKFGIDPTDPHFKKTKGMEAIITERQNRVSQARKQKQRDPSKSLEKPSNEKEKGSRSNDVSSQEVSDLVASIKRKAAPVSIAHRGETKKRKQK